MAAGLCPPDHTIRWGISLQPLIPPNHRHMKRAIHNIVLLAVSLVLVCGADQQPSLCPNLLAKLYECVDHVAYFQANDAKGELDTILDCCKQYDVYSEAKCFWYDRWVSAWMAVFTPRPPFSPECTTGNDLVAHARTYGLEMLQGFCAGMDHGPVLMPVASTLPQAGYEAAQQAAEQAAQQAAKLANKPSVVKRGPAKDLETVVSQQRDIDLTMEFSGVSGINADDLSAALGTRSNAQRSLVVSLHGVCPRRPVAGHAWLCWWGRPPRSCPRQGQW